MNNKYLDSRNPPYKWMPACELWDREYEKERNKMLSKVQPEYPFFTDSCFKLIQIISIPWDVAYNTLLIRGMSWVDLKSNIFVHLASVDDERKTKINIDNVKDIGLSYTPKSDFHRFGCIDCKNNDPFVVIDDNAMLFIHQIKYTEGWLFHV